MAILTVIRWYFIVILIWVSLVTNDVEHLFIYLPAICVSSLEMYLFRSSLHYSLRLLIYLCYWVVWVPCVFWNINPLLNMWFANILSQSIGAFSFCWWLPLLFLLVSCWSTCFCFCCQIQKKKKNHCQDQCQRDYLLCFLLYRFRFYFQVFNPF